MLQRLAAVFLEESYWLGALSSLAEVGMLLVLLVLAQVAAVAVTIATLWITTRVVSRLTGLEQLTVARAVCWVYLAAILAAAVWYGHGLG